MFDIINLFDGLTFRLFCCLLRLTFVLDSVLLYGLLSTVCFCWCFVLLHLFILLVCLNFEVLTGALFWDC